MFRDRKTGRIIRTAEDKTRAIEHASGLHMTDAHMIAVALTRIADALDEINFKIDEQKEEGR